MPSRSSLVGTAAITESMLKRKWSAAILRYLDKGVTDPIEIVKREPSLTPSVVSDRLRMMLRYSLISRFPGPPPNHKLEYRVSPRGKKILKLLDTIDELDAQFLDGYFGAANQATLKQAEDDAPKMNRRKKQNTPSL